MAKKKVTILLQEGPLHGQEIKLDGPLKTEQHFIHEGFLYRVINNGEYAQCCGPSQAPEKPSRKKAASKKTKKSTPKKAASKKKI